MLVEKVAAVFEDRMVAYIYSSRGVLSKMSPASAPAPGFGLWILKALAGQLVSVVLIVIVAGLIFRSIFHNLSLVLLFLQFPGIVAFPIWYLARKYVGTPKKSALVFAVGVFVYTSIFLSVAICLATRLEIMTNEMSKSLIVPIPIATLLGSLVAFNQAFRRLSARVVHR
jgi:hypothetical protein